MTINSDTPVIDVDVHIHESYADLEPYFEMPWRRALEGAPAWRPSAAGAQIFDTPGLTPLTSYDPMLGDFPEQEPHLVTSPDILRADLDHRYIDAALIFTGRLLKAATGNDHLYAAALGRAYNRYLSERWVDPQRGIYGAIMAVNQAPEEAAGEIRRYAGQEGLVAVYLPMAGNYPLWGDRSHESIFAAAEEAGLPVVLQGTLTVHTVFPYQLHHLPTALAKQTLSQPFGALANLVSLLTTGVLTRHPNLRVVFTDVGVSWLPFLLERLDHFYPYLRDEVPFLEQPPSEYARRQVYVTTHPLDSGRDPAFTIACLEAIGAGHVLFGSDWPHFDAGSPERVRQLPIAEEAKRQILGGNAAELLRLPALADIISN